MFFIFRKLSNLEMLSKFNYFLVFQFWVDFNAEKFIFELGLLEK